MAHKGKGRIAAIRKALALLQEARKAERRLRRLLKTT